MKNILILAMIAMIALSLSTQSVIGQSGEQERFIVIPNQDGKKYQWQDGDNSISLWEAENLVMERYDPNAPAEQSQAIAEEDVLGADDKLRVVKKQSWHEIGDDVFPVLVSSGGGWRALPGGVLVVLMPDMKKAGIDAFFARMNLTKISPMTFTQNAYLIETEPGLVGLELSNRLATTKEVDLASPNWWTPVQLR